MLTTENRESVKKPLDHVCLLTALMQPYWTAHKAQPSRFISQTHLYACSVPSGNNSFLQLLSFTSSLWPLSMPTHPRCFPLLTPWYPVYIPFITVTSFCTYLTVCMPAPSWITSFSKVESGSCCNTQWNNLMDEQAERQMHELS